MPSIISFQRCTCRESPVVLKAPLSGWKCNLCLHRSVKTFHGHGNNHNPHGITQGMVSNSTNSPGIKMEPGKSCWAQYHSVILFFGHGFSSCWCKLKCPWSHMLLSPLLHPAYQVGHMDVPNLRWSLEFTVIKSRSTWLTKICLLHF